MSLVDADFGHWAWGRGEAMGSNVIPVAVITHGYDEQQRSLLFQMALDPAMEPTFRTPIRRRLQDSGFHTCRRADVFDDAAWRSSKMRTDSLLFGGEEWLVSVRYASLDTWSNMLFIRKQSKTEFSPEHVELVNLAMSAVPWLHATAEETLPAEIFRGITARQSTVLLMLLDGHSRKMIASHLGVTLETVGDHVKAIYKHFQVNSVTELAAKFLRNL